MSNMINFSHKSISNNDIKVVSEILKSGWLTQGKYTKLFEEEFSRFVNSKYAVTVNSCTAGLHLSCLALEIKRGDEVILPAMSHTATAHAIEYTGAKPVFVDIKNDLSGNIDPKVIESKINKKTKAIIIVHMSGFACDMKEILKICKTYKLKLIEDCAHGLGTFFKKKHVGNFGISGCFSFYPTKHITTGEGGMIISNDQKFIKKIKQLKAFGIDTDIKNRKIPGLYNVKRLGYNYRMTDFQAAIGYHQLIRFKKNLLIRKRNAKIYEQYLASTKIKFKKFNNDCSYFIYQIFVKNRNKLIKLLKKKNIGTSIHYATPIPFFDYYKKYNFKKDNFKNSILYSKQSISLPVHHQIDKKQIIQISKIILEFLKGK
jgi:perosamine synthetase